VLTTIELVFVIHNLIFTVCKTTRAPLGGLLIVSETAAIIWQINIYQPTLSDNSPQDYRIC
jgi:hypothetical protein